jgi:hypothetical protein
MMAWYQKQQWNCRVTFLIEKYNKHDRSCYGKTSRTVTQQIVLLAGTESCHYNHMNEKVHGGIRRRRSRMRKMTFLHEKSIKTSDSFCKTHNEWWYSDNTYLPARRRLLWYHSWCKGAHGGRWQEEVGGTWQGTQVGYTSFLRGPSQKAATAHFHLENQVESGILWAAAECAHNLKKNEWMEFDPIRWNLEPWISFGNFPTKLLETRWISFWKS